MIRQFLAILTLMLLLGANSADAAILYLKDGSTIEGKILNRNDYSVTVENRGVPTKLFSDQVDHILEDKDFGSNPLGLEAAKINPATARKTNLIITLLEANGTLEKMRANIEQVIEQSGIENQENLRKLFNINEMAESLVPVYAEFYSESELEALVQFYNSPLGKKTLQVSPAILEKTMKAHVDYFQEKLGPK